MWYPASAALCASLGSIRAEGILLKLLFWRIRMILLFCAFGDSPRWSGCRLGINGRGISCRRRTVCLFRTLECPCLLTLFCCWCRTLRIYGRLLKQEGLFCWHSSRRCFWRTIISWMLRQDHKISEDSENLPHQCCDMSRTLTLYFSFWTYCYCLVWLFS